MDRLLELDILELPEGTIHVDTWGFARGKFKRLILPGSLRTVGMSAFKDCPRLTEVSMSPNTYCFDKNVHHNDDGIFAGCPKLEHVIFRGPLCSFVWNTESEPMLLRGFHPEKTFHGCFELKRMTAWEVPLSKFPDGWRRFALTGFLADPGRRQNYAPSVAAEYDAVLSRMGDSLINRAMRDPDFGLCHYLMEQRLIDRQSFDSLLDAAMRSGDPQLSAALLAYERAELRRPTSPLDRAWSELEGL